MTLPAVLYFLYAYRMRSPGLERIGEAGIDPEKVAFDSVDIVRRVTATERHSRFVRDLVEELDGRSIVGVVVPVIGRDETQVGGDVAGEPVVDRKAVADRALQRGRVEGEVAVDVAAEADPADRNQSGRHSLRTCWNRHRCWDRVPGSSRGWRPRREPNRRTTRNYSRRRNRFRCRICCRTAG